METQRKPPPSWTGFSTRLPPLSTERQPSSATHRAQSLLHPWVALRSATLHEAVDAILE